ncbi:NAD(P)-dependent oxidoreductase [Yeosuana marina]|uniref:NAD(P)-dependent oxidoreductase n=1 Tax=Yeosuana marina TaxID=1565536 RepID=UPI00141ED70F|nr:NAD(P)-dependent oxidoreductase [Yeosuana marina]
MKISFIGLGIMGEPMAKNLLKSRYDLTVYNRSQKSLDKLKSMGANTAKSFQDAVIDADLVITMLSTPQVIEELTLCEPGFISKMKKDAIWMDCSTVNPSFAKEMFKETKKKNVNYIEAPVAGSKPQAEAAILTFFVSGEDRLIKKIQPVLGYMGKKIIKTGESIGSASTFKIIVNSLLANSMLMFSEALRFGESAGLKKDFLLETLPLLPVTPPFIAAKADKIRMDDFSAQFPLEWMHKDLLLASLTSKEINCDLTLTELTKHIFAEANNNGFERLDFSAIYKFLNKP